MAINTTDLIDAAKQWCDVDQRDAAEIRLDRLIVPGNDPDDAILNIARGTHDAGDENVLHIVLESGVILMVPLFVAYPY